MPIYEFVCESCGHEFEKILSFSATDTPACPTCEADAVKRRLSRPAIHFKGSGWYITDSKQSNNGANGNGKTTSSESSESSSESKTESATSEPAKGESSKGESSKSETTKSDSSTAKTTAAEA